MNRTSCSTCREDWMAAFDREEAPPERVVAHLEACASCRELAAAAQWARESLRAVPLPAPDPHADRALLAALDADRSPRPRPAFRDALRFRSMLPLAAAGLGSFAVTLLVAGGLAQPRSAGPSRTAHVESGRTRQVSAEAESRLESWLAQPVPSAVPPRALPARTRDRRPETGDRRDHGMNGGVGEWGNGRA